MFNKIFKRYLLGQGIFESHIITIELDQRKNKKYRDPDVILDYIESLIEDDEPYYIMLDEVQMLQEFEEVLNSLLHIKNADIYVMGSNSKFLSKDVITEFRGRGDEVHIYPLTFREFMEAYDGDMYRGWAEYIVYGGLPLTVTMKTEEQKIFKLHSEYALTGDQPQAIEKLVKGFQEGNQALAAQLYGEFKGFFPEFVPAKRLRIEKLCLRMQKLRFSKENLRLGQKRLSRTRIDCG